MAVQLEDVGAIPNAEALYRHAVSWPSDSGTTVNPALDRSNLVARRPPAASSRRLALSEGAYPDGRRHVPLRVVAPVRPRRDDHIAGFDIAGSRISRAPAGARSPMLTIGRSGGVAAANAGGCSGSTAASLKRHRYDGTPAPRQGEAAEPLGLCLRQLVRRRPGRL